MRFLYQESLLQSEDASFNEQTAEILTGQRIWLSSASPYIVRKITEDTATLQDAENPHFIQELSRELLEIMLENQKTAENRKAEQLYTEFRDIHKDNSAFQSTVKYNPLTERLEEISQNRPVFEETDYVFSNSFSRPAAEANYRLLSEYAPDIFNGTLDYLRLESDVFEPIYIERISDTQIAMAHTYLINGDIMLDPEITFHLDSSAQCLYPLSFEQSDIGIYHRVISEDAYGKPELNVAQAQEINEFCQMWFHNLASQGHIPVRGIKHMLSGDQEYHFTGDRRLIPLENSKSEPISASQMHEDRSAEIFIGSIPELHRSDAPASQPDPYYCGPKTRFQRNVAAIRLLKQLEAEDRLANPQEQTILRRYAGWGGLSNAFDANWTQWQSECTVINPLISKTSGDTNYRSISRSPMPIINVTLPWVRTQMHVKHRRLSL